MVNVLCEYRPHSVPVGGKNDVAAYSALRMVDDMKSGARKLLVVWEAKPNFLFTRIDTDWCSNCSRIYANASDTKR